MVKNPWKSQLPLPPVERVPKMPKVKPPRRETKNEEGLEFLLQLEGKTYSPGNEDNHYKGGCIECPHCNEDFEIEPIDYIEAQELGAHEANIVKYISRWKEKGGIKDLFKVAWYTMKLIRHVERQMKREENK